jgi:hypothetical protein
MGRRLTPRYFSVVTHTKERPYARRSVVPVSCRPKPHAPLAAIRDRQYKTHG